MHAFEYQDINHATRHKPQSDDDGFSVALKDGRRLTVPNGTHEAEQVKQWLKARAEG